MKKKSEGITLVALVVTIIVLLILAGVSLNLVAGSSGILAKAKLAVDETNLAIEQEKQELQEIEKLMTLNGMKEDDVFEAYYEEANEKLNELTTEQKIAQMFIIGNSNQTNYTELATYQFGGYLFFKDFFDGKTEAQVKSAIQSYQNAVDIPVLISVDEEGGSVVRVSSNSNLAPNGAFKASSEIYAKSGLEGIRQDTIEKSNFLKNLGINLNFAPVVDVANNEEDYMYNRALKQDKDVTAMFAQTVVNASKGLGVSYTLKHFPGYGNNKDTHIGASVDERTYEEIYENDLEPFRAGIKAGAEAVMISHNVVTSIDDQNQASISQKVHQLLRNDLGFTGIIITDALNMGAIADEKATKDAIVQAIWAGNDMMILSVDSATKDKLTGVSVTYQYLIDAVKEGLASGKITQEMIDEAVTRILAWKYSKGMIE